MRILGFTDIHGVRHRIVEFLQKEPDIDLVLIAGDLTTNGTARDAESLLDHFGQKEPAVYAVSGNMDPLPVEDVLERHRVALNAQGTMHGPLGLFGLSGAPLSPLHTPNEVTEEELAARLERGWDAVKAAARTILVSHPPPAGTRVDALANGKHVGSTAVRDFCLAHGPDVVLCGHIHEARGIDHLGRTIVVNPGPAQSGSYCIITVDQTIEVDLRSL